MDKTEFAKWAMALKTYYPKENLLPNTQAMELWYNQLKDIPYNVAEASLEKWVATNKWSPSIADIRESYMSVIVGDMPTWGEAWEKVLTAIRCYGSYRPAEGMASLDELTARTVTMLGGFIELCRSENIDIDRANFRKIYEELAARKQKDSLISPSLRNVISGIFTKHQEVLEKQKS